jgi:hypothetical protein
MNIIYDKQIFLRSIVFIPIKIGLIYMAYLALSPVTLICFSLITIALINITQGNIDLQMISPLLVWFGFPESGNVSFGAPDILSFYWKFSLILMISVEIFFIIWKKVGKTRVHLTSSKKFKIGLIFITSTMILAQISTLLPNAPEGARSLVWILVIFWLIAIVAYSIYTALILLMDKVNAAPSPHND